MKPIVEKPVNRKSTTLNITSTVLTFMFAASCNGSDAGKSDDKTVTTDATQTTAAANTSSDPDARFWAQATVHGSKQELKLFDEKLKVVLGFSDLEAHEIGCVDGCDKFDKPDPLDKIVYVFPRDTTSVLSKFAETWDARHKVNKLPNFKIDIETAKIVGDCDPITEPAPCTDMPFCATDGCGKMVSGVPRCKAC